MRGLLKHARNRSRARRSANCDAPSVTKISASTVTTSYRDASAHRFGNSQYRVPLLSHQERPNRIDRSANSWPPIVKRVTADAIRNYGLAQWWSAVVSETSSDWAAWCPVSQGDEVAESDQLRFRGMALLQLGQRLVQGKQSLRELRLGRFVIRQIRAVSTPAAVGAPFLPGSIHQNPPYGFGSGGEKVPSTIPPLHLRHIHEPDVSLVDPIPCGQRVARILALQLLRGKAPQFVVN